LLRKPSKLLDYLNQIQSPIGADSIFANWQILSGICVFCEPNRLLAESLTCSARQDKYQKAV
jgi:hypothetical protein